MKMKQTVVKNQRSWLKIESLRLAISLFISVLVLLAQTFPSMATSASGSGSDWVEICSNGETYLAPIDLGEGAPEPVCTHCSACLVPANDNSGLLTFGLLQQRPKSFISFNYFILKEVFLAGPEQYWSSCRGPPIRKTKIDMVSSFHNPITGPAGVLDKTQRGPSWV